MSKIALGKAVPAFSLPAQGGARWNLKDARGQHLVLYFYPRDNTAGCSTEAAAFRDAYAQFTKAKTLVVGVSPDSIASHEKFRAKLALPFELLSDADHSVSNLFGVYKEKVLYGRKYMGIERSTFLIDAKGVLRQEWRKVRVPGHVDAVLEAARHL